MKMRPCWVEISTASLEQNYRFLERLAAPAGSLLAIVKANAYGHSLEICAPAAVRAGARWLGVTTVEEGAIARSFCPEPQILVIGGVFPGQAKALIANRLTAVAWETWQLDEMIAAARAAGAHSGSLPVHLEIDTGMSRQGVMPGDFGAVLERFAPGSPLRLEAVMTHFYAADEADGRATAGQLEVLDKAIGEIGACGFYAEWLSVGSSATLLSGQVQQIAAMAARHGMQLMLRPGLALYGLVPEFSPAFTPPEPAGLAQARLALRPVLAWKSAVVAVHSVPAGTAVGYNGTFVATEPMRLALIAVGYADGLDRRLGNNFHLLIRGQRAPLVGRVSMDQAVLDATEIEGVKAGDEVVLLGAQGGETITAFDHAHAAGTIAWEILTRIGARVPRKAV